MVVDGVIIVIGGWKQRWDNDEIVGRKEGRIILDDLWSFILC